jgi:hypothetical protein
MLPSFGANATLAQALSADQTKGYTLFAPDNDALAGATDVLAGLANNSTALLALMGNHVRSTPSLLFPSLLTEPITVYQRLIILLPHPPLPLLTPQRIHLLFRPAPLIHHKLFRSIRHQLKQS